MHHSFSKEQILILLTNSIKIILDSILKNTQCYQGNKHGLQGILEAWVTATEKPVIIIINN